MKKVKIEANQNMGGGKWLGFITLATAPGWLACSPSEIGPFDTEQEALDAATARAKKEGWVIV